MTLPRHRKTQLTVVTEAALEKLLVREARERGAQSWSVAEVHGGAVEGVREGSWEADRTVRIDLICEPDVAERVAEHVLATYAAHYSVSLHFCEVWVVRPDRY
jgi:nitrogen regulatory protein P-II 2